jgi:hypothetical protein
VELARFDEQSYQFGATHISNCFPFKYEPPSFLSMKIITSSKLQVTPSLVPPIAIIKLVSPLRGGTRLEIIPLPI